MGDILSWMRVTFYLLNNKLWINYNTSFLFFSFPSPLAEKGLGEEVFFFTLTFILSHPCLRQVACGNQGEEIIKLKEGEGDQKFTDLFIYCII